jgi:acetyl esterase/lipase
MIRLPALFCLWMLLPLHAADTVGGAPVPSPRASDQVIHPWQEGGWKGQPLPGDWKIDGPEVSGVIKHMGGTLTLKNISDPILAYYAPDKKPVGPVKGMVVCPGGGYHILAWDLEGTEIATFLNQQGYHAWVLKYRLPREGQDPVRHLPALQDAQRSISYLRSQAGTIGLDPAGIGIMGFSAGGHLAAITSASGNERAYPARDAIDAISCRPDFSALIYPAYLMKDDKIAGLVPGPGAPPAFLSHSADDELSYQNSSGYFDALRSHKIRAELHIWPDGGHGYGMRSPDSAKAWPSLLAAWLAK